jgi:hypothetical protein
MTQQTDRSQALVQRRALTYGLVLTGAVAVLGAGIGFLVSGTTGLLSGLLGAAVAAVFMALTTVSYLVAVRVTKGDGTNPAFYGIMVGVWFLKLVVFVVLLILVRGFDWLDARVMFVSMVVAVVGSLVADVLAVVRTRVPYVDVELPGPRSGA